MDVVPSLLRLGFSFDRYIRVSIPCRPLVVHCVKWLFSGRELVQRVAVVFKSQRPFGNIKLRVCLIHRFKVGKIVVVLYQNVTKLGRLNFDGQKHILELLLLC